MGSALDALESGQLNWTSRMARKKGALKGRLSIDLASTPHGGHPYGHAMDLETDPTPSTSSPTASSSPSPSASAPPPPIPPVAAEDADCPRVTAHIKWCMAHSYPRRAPLDVAVEANVPPPSSPRSATTSSASSPSATTRGHRPC